jgi:hypothetical protein
MAVMTQVRLDRLDRITAEARDVEIGRAILTLIAAVLFAIGWVAAKVVGVVWLSLAWSATAVRLGWSEARASQAPQGTHRPQN